MSAREQAHDVMAQAWLQARREGRWPMTNEIIYGLIDALLAATQEEPCPTCAGTGDKIIYDESGYGNPPERESCPTCEGSGRVPGAPLVILLAQEVLDFGGAA